MSGLLHDRVPTHIDWLAGGVVENGALAVSGSLFFGLGGVGHVFADVGRESTILV